MPQGNPRACVPSACAPKAASFCIRFGIQNTLNFCVFPPALWRSFGRGKFCTSSGGFVDPRTGSNLHGTASHGQRLSPWFFAPRFGRSSRTAAASTAQVSGRFSRSACCTSHATQRSRAWQLSSACVPGNTPRSSACSIPASCMVSAASSRSGSPPGKTKSAQATTSHTGIHHGSGAGFFDLWHGHFDIHEIFSVTQLALVRHIPHHSSWDHRADRLFAAERANCLVISHQYFTTNLQQFQLLLLRNERRYIDPQDRKE